MSFMVLPSKLVVNIFVTFIEDLSYVRTKSLESFKPLYQCYGLIDYAVQVCSVSSIARVLAFTSLYVA